MTAKKINVKKRGTCHQTFKLYIFYNRRLKNWVADPRPDLIRYVEKRKIWYDPGPNWFNRSRSRSAKGHKSPILTSRRSLLGGWRLPLELGSHSNFNISKRKILLFFTSKV
jgi:hypothetical protein